MINLLKLAINLSLVLTLHLKLIWSLFEKWYFYNHFVTTFGSILSLILSVLTLSLFLFLSLSLSIVFVRKEEGKIGCPKNGCTNIISILILPCWPWVLTGKEIAIGICNDMTSELGYQELRTFHQVISFEIHHSMSVQ